jgi:hypothetical protein
LNRFLKRLGKYNLVAIIIMFVGLILFLLTPVLLLAFNFDSDIFGVFIFAVGLAMWIVGFIVKMFRGNKRAG